jgi:cell wall-associated NlpC family hydrolase
MTRAGRIRRRGAVIALGALVGGLLLQLAGPAASAETPQQQATALAAKVQQLQAAAEEATEAYDQEQGRLGQVTAQRFAAEAAVTTAQAADAQTIQADDTSVRDLYELGGPAVLYTSVLAHGGDPSVVQSRLIAAQNILGDDRKAAAAAGAHAQRALVAQQRAEALADEQLALEAQVTARSQQIQLDLGQTQQLLATADAQVAVLEQAAQARQQAADHAEFLQQLAMAQAGEGQYAAQLAGAAPASSPAAATALAAAEALEGHPYQWGGTGPIGYDCSGMTGAAYAAAGIHLPRTAAQQYLSGPHVPLADLEPGDLLFWAFDPADPATIHHTAIYAGNGLMVSADHTGDTVRLQPVWWDGYAGATRPDATQAATVGGPQWVAGTGA